uniref:Cation/H+ exchanger transmembrane domain-containing protein n=1 Tax=Pyrodinium bahamense TaxID=73915 RepID=A0A7R9ZWL3_9DINO|mmetsp:Transcript_12689/g.35070  ORF Transcript_12689/g.35070 Transcript_12689/m.35070 type:complete len:603 (+) Transcript_12689:122-1930(+)
MLEMDNKTENSTSNLMNATSGLMEAPDAHDGRAFAIFEHHIYDIVIATSGLLMMALVIGNLLHKHDVTWMPESLVVIFLGAILGFGWKYLINDGEFNWETDAEINDDLLQAVFLPIIIFEAGWSLKNKEFISQLPYIMIFAVLGTIICMVVVAELLIHTSAYHGIGGDGENGVRLAFTYGALIAAVDPVATLATYAHLNVEPLLNILVMGESIINDAVAITLFEVLNGEGFTEAQTRAELVGVIAKDTCWLLLGSVSVGLLWGVALSFVVRVAGLRHTPPMAILFVLSSAYFVYHVSQHKMKLSGIICILFCGMVMSSFVPNHLSVEGSLLCSFLLKQLSSLADMAVFLFVGLAISLSRPEGFRLGCFVMLFCLLGRALATFPLAGVCNIIKAQVGKKLEKEKRLMISPKHMFMMWHAGLRGGIALVLCLQLGTWCGQKQKIQLIQATTLLICVFLLVFGGTTSLLLKCLGIPLGSPPPMYLQGTCFSRLIFEFSRVALKPLLTGGAKRDLTMHGSVVQHIMNEARIKHDIEREIYRDRHPDASVRMGMFGQVDPLQIDQGWAEGDPDDERWMQFYHADREGRSEDSEASDSVMGTSSADSD